MTGLIRYAETGRKRDYGCQDIYVISGFLWDIHRRTEFWHYKPVSGMSDTYLSAESALLLI